MVDLDAGVGFLLCRILILSMVVVLERRVWTWALRVLMGVLGGSDGRWRVKVGFRVDLRVMSMVGVEMDSVTGSEPGGGAFVGVDLGGRGCGGCESFGRVYCT